MRPNHEKKEQKEKRKGTRRNAIRRNETNQYERGNEKARKNEELWIERKVKRYDESKMKERRMEVRKKECWQRSRVYFLSRLQEREKEKSFIYICALSSNSMKLQCSVIVQ